MIGYLETACSVCERGASVERYKHIVFDSGVLRSFNGLLTYQAPSGLEHDAPFAVHEDRLAQALRSCSLNGDDAPKVSLTKEFMVLKQGRLTVRVRKLELLESIYSPAVSAPKKALKLDESFQAAVKRVLPFVSADATRPWSVSVLIRDGYAWATNNLSMARSPCALSLSLRIPQPAAAMLAELPALDWLHEEKGIVTVGAGAALLSFPQQSDDWPSDLNRFFKDMPKKLPLLDEDLLAAAKTVERLADRFVALTEESVKGSTATLETEYEIQVKRGKGIYSARLLSLIVEHATHGDFVRYPDPVFLRGEELEICAVGVRPENARA